MLRAVDLFCGSGGFSVGLIQAGVQVLSAYDNWSDAVDTYRRNIGDHVHKFDLSDAPAAIREVAKHGADVIVGGPPCQDFSTAGKREEGHQANLTISFGQIVRACRPELFLMENVPQTRMSAAYKSMRESLESSGYQFAEHILDASYCGAPQARKRFFVFGWEGNGSEPGIRFSRWLSERQASEPLTVKDYMRKDINIKFYYRHPRNYSRRAVFTVHEPSPTIRGVNRPVPPNYQRNHLDSADPSTVRPLTTWERSRIQTFSRDWDWNAGDRNASAELQIGNAVPVKLAEFVAKGMLHAVE